MGSEQFTFEQSVGHSRNQGGKFKNLYYQTKMETHHTRIFEIH